jgi:hypothetical protein
MSDKDKKNSISDWLLEHGRGSAFWFAKRLAANDTLATHAHQAGPYLPKEFLFRVFPQLNRPGTLNPDAWFDLNVDSHGSRTSVRAIWYNNRLHGGTRNEARITNFGGQRSAILDPDSTGALTIFAFEPGATDDAPECHVWVCRNKEEEDLVEERIGPVEPGRFFTSEGAFLSSKLIPARVGLPSCRLRIDQIPPDWFGEFPDAQEIIHRTFELRPDDSSAADQRLLRRRNCEYEMFRSIEEAVEMPIVRRGFDNIEAFLSTAQSILQRRKARSGRSLELHVRQIFLEVKLKENVEFAYQPQSEVGKRPDFLFPSEAAYRDASWPADRLRMLATKTTCKDRWRQILNEADRIPRKHLLTLQEGVSENQFREMAEAKVTLVVPRELQTRFPASVRPRLESLEEFVREVKRIVS